MNHHESLKSVKGICIKYIRYDLNVSTVATFVNADLHTIFTHTKFCISNTTSPLVTAVKLKAKHKFLMSPYCFKFYKIINFNSLLLELNAQSDMQQIRIEMGAA